MQEAETNSAGWRLEWEINCLAYVNLGGKSGELESGLAKFDKMLSSIVMQMKRLSLLLLLSALPCSLGLVADTVYISDGSQLQGKILKISEGKLKLKTDFAGEIEISLNQVERFSTDEATSVRLADGNVLVGPVSASGSDAIAIDTSGGTVTAPTSEVRSAWTQGERDPSQVAHEAELRSQIRKWSYEAAVSITGRTGNTERTGIGSSASATLSGPNDRLNIYASYNYATETTGPRDARVRTRSADEAILGMSYTSYFSKRFGWYIRQEVEYDTFENIDFRSTTAAGISYRILNEERHRLETRAGIAYRYESYYDLDFDGDGVVSIEEAQNSSDNFPGLDFGVIHYWRFADWGEMNNTLTYTPSLDDFGDYLVDHRSWVDVPLGTSEFWRLRFSLSNQYNSAPTGNRKKMDTMYGLSLLLNWR